MLISNQPDLIAFDNNWGIGMESVFDFFKPHQSTSDATILNALGTTKSEIDALVKALNDISVEMGVIEKTNAEHR